MLRNIKFFLIFNLTAGILAMGLPAHASYTIFLNNGEQLQAEGYKIDGESITLRFRQGSATFPGKLVKSIAGTPTNRYINPEPETPQPEQALQPQEPQAEPISGPQDTYAPPLTASPQADDNPDDTSYINEGDGPGAGEAR